MKRIKLIVKQPKDATCLLGFEALLVDAETNEPIHPLQDFTVSFPLEGEVRVNANLLLSEVEVVDQLPTNKTVTRPANEAVAIGE